MTADARLASDITVVGLGLVGVHQITHEVEETIRRSNETFVTDVGIGVLDHLRTVGPRVTDLTSRHELGTHRILIYRRMAAEVVAAALDHAPVCFATYGHPRMLCYPTALIQRASQVLDLRLEVLPGISFVDMVLDALGVDPGFDGLQLYESTDLVVRRRPLQPDVNCIIAQAPITLDPYNLPGPQASDNLARLQNHLAEFYPEDHQAVLLLVKTHPLLDNVMRAVAIGQLADALRQSASAVTIFIPPVARRQVADESLAEMMRLPADEPQAASQAPPRRPGRPPIGPTPRR